MAPRNFRQPFNRPQLHANGKNALRSLMAVTETRRPRHGRRHGMNRFLVSATR